jgi:hypothetical protein
MNYMKRSTKIKSTCLLQLAIFTTLVKLKTSTSIRSAQDVSANISSDAGRAADFGF